jgi:tetratricopeptide (TPR) repeat protein/CHAT domain-containing protein
LHNIMIVWSPGTGPILRRRHAILVISALALFAVAPSSRAQTGDLAQLQKRFEELFERGDYAAALSEAQKLDALVRSRVGPNHPSNAIALGDIALVLAAQNRFAEAEPIYKRVLALQEKSLGPSHPNIAATLTDLGNMYAAQARFQEAEAVFRRTLAISERSYGAAHVNTAIALNNLGNVQTSLGQHRTAEETFRRSLPIFERSSGADHPETLKTMSNLATAYEAQGRFGEAEPLYRRTLEALEKARGPSHGDVASALGNLAANVQSQGRYGESRTLLTRALAIRESAPGGNPADVALVLNNLAGASWALGRWTEAESLYGRALALQERALGPEHDQVAITLGNLAGVFRDEGRGPEAEPLYQRAVAIKEKTFGKEHPGVARMLGSLAALYREQGRYADVEPVIRRAIAIQERALGPRHPELATTLTILAMASRAQGRHAEAEPLFHRAIAILQATFGDNNAELAAVTTNLANLYWDQKRYDEAERLHRQALAIRETAFGANHPEAARAANNLARLAAERGDQASALAMARKATAVVLAQDAAPSADDFIAQRASYLRHHVGQLAAAMRAGGQPPAALTDEAFDIAQWASLSSASAAVQKLGARFAAGGDALAAVVRESQDLADRRRGKDRALAAALGKPVSQQDRASIESLRAEIGALDQSLTATTARLQREFPDYAALANARPLKASAVQRRLGPDEALAFWLVDDKQTHVFALTRERMLWRNIPLGANDLAAKVAAFRRGLDVNDFVQSVAAGKPELFDLTLAHELSAALVGSVEELIKGKRLLFVVPTGALTALPFHLLVTDAPAAAPASAEDAAFRNAAWLIKRHAIAVLPSVASLEALRSLATKDTAAKPMIGFGDPLFGDEAAGGGQRSTVRRRAVTRSYADFWRGAGVDRDKLAQALPRLPETADELRAVAKNLGAPAADLHLAKDASEATVKRAKLADYRVVYFATHGLVAGDIKGLGEPALALTLPQTPSDLDDGVLTASEISQLKLNADWVVLSACNTIAGDTPGAEALSGLARAFFYAGARSLLVSHWAVDSAAALRLTTTTFDRLKAGAGGAVGRAEALQQAMLAYLNDASSPTNAYPAYWGPFSIVGEGAR